MVCCSLKIPLPSYVAAERTLCIRKNIPWSSLLKPKRIVINTWESRAAVKRDKGKSRRRAIRFNSQARLGHHNCVHQVREQRGSSSSERVAGSRSRQDPTMSQEHGLATVRHALLQANHCQEGQITISLCSAHEATCEECPGFGLLVQEFSS